MYFAFCANAVYEATTFEVDRLKKLMSQDRNMTFP